MPMPTYGYSVKPDPEKTAIASAREVPVKPKHVVNVCKAIKGMSLERAKAFLEEVQELETAVPFVRHKRKVAHRRGKVGPGQFPVKAAGKVLEVVKGAEANAEYKGLDPEKLFVQHAAAQRARVVRGMMPGPRGSGKPWNKSLTHIEIVVAEKEEA